MELKLYQVDAFSDHIFGGNPAAVVPLDSPLDEALMQSIAAENNLAETAFFYPERGHFRLRWFTPTTEVPLCGHATLASAFILFEYLGFDQPVVHFECVSGSLYVTQTETGLQLDFPGLSFARHQAEEILEEAFSGVSFESFVTEGDTNLLLVLPGEAAVADISPDLNLLRKLSGHGVIVTSESDRSDVDFVSRYFAPSMGIDEDPVTGSIHCALTPFWAQRLGKQTLKAEQISRRRGHLLCHLRDDRVLIEGCARLYLKGSIFVD